MSRWSTVQAAEEHPARHRVASLPEPPPLALSLPPPRALRGLFLAPHRGPALLRSTEAMDTALRTPAMTPGYSPSPAPGDRSDRPAMSAAPRFLQGLPYRRAPRYAPVAPASKMVSAESCSQSVGRSEFRSYDPRPALSWQWTSERSRPLAVPRLRVADPATSGCPRRS